MACACSESGAYTVHRPEHWIFDGCSLTEGDEFGGDHTMVGYECDGCEFVLGADGAHTSNPRFACDVSALSERLLATTGRPVPTHSDGTPSSFEILGSAPAIWAPGDSWWYDEWDKVRAFAFASLCSRCFSAVFAHFGANLCRNESALRRWACIRLRVAV